jgi:hypothetical protein
MTSRSLTPRLRHLTHTCTTIAVATLLAACDNSKGPTNPRDPTPGDIFRGTAGLTIVAPFDDKCTARTPAWGQQPPTILSQGTITQDGSGWIYRVDGRFGNFQINFQSRDMTDTELTLSGAAQGTAADMLSTIRFANPDRVGVSGAGGASTATVDGTFSTRLSGVNGRVTGTLAFTDNQGGVTTCSEGLLFLFLLNR